MKLFQVLFLSLFVTTGGLSCSSSAENPSRNIDLQDYSPEQIKTLQRYHHIQTGILAKHYNQQALERKALTGQTEAQIQSIENLQQIQQTLDQIREAEATMVRDYYAEELLN